METNTIQATFTLTLTKEQLLSILGAAAPAAVEQQIPVQIQPAPMQTAPMPMQTAPAPMPVQTAQQTYSVQDLMLAARPLVENKRQQELLALLAEFGVSAVTAIPENRRAEFAARLRALGGQI